MLCGWWKICWRSHWLLEIRVGSLFFNLVLVALSSSEIILSEEESWLNYFNWVVAICVLRPFLVVPWVGLQSVIVTFCGHILLYK